MSRYLIRNVPSPEDASSEQQPIQLLFCYSYIARLSIHTTPLGDSYIARLSMRFFFSQSASLKKKRILLESSAVIYIEFPFDLACLSSKEKKERNGKHTPLTDTVGWKFLSLVTRREIVHVNSACIVFLLY
ncbi:hypothetical protein KP509_24G079300 [Ceratopteris richardii]|uniref:Uncharacterized protein n=1 Tax=Ceratopteris richardii TaxID=49495 RepID=A0A8T2RYW7_CERRI|nr:hypothetical protein KP509_24G079300 [Ceratopteris richardii]